MPKHWQALIFSGVFILFGGCVIINDNLDYPNHLSDYEVKSIVKKLFMSQQTFTQAALLSSEGLHTLVSTHDDTYSQYYRCHNQGYFTINLNNDNSALVFNRGEKFSLAYVHCTYETYVNLSSHLNGAVMLTYYQNRYDYDTRLLDFSIDYTHTYLYMRYSTYYLEGRVGVHFDQELDRHRLKLILSSNRFYLSQENYEADLFANIVLDFTLNTYNQHYRYSYSGILFNSRLGRLSFTTSTDLEGYGADYPYCGEFKIANAHITIIVQPLDNYYVDIELKNHDYPEQNRIIHTTWINIGLS